ncbi:MAG: Bax inhibitor-1/YccA family protein [Candidatus Promineifilaceae bacterium]
MTQQIPSFQPDYKISQTEIDNALAAVMTRVYMLMAAGLVLTALIAQWTYSSGLYVRFALNPLFFYGLLLGEVLLVMAIGRSLGRLSPRTSMMLFLLYSAINGLTMSVIIAMYTPDSIALVFGITAGMFGIMSFVGFTTKTDMSKYSSFFMMALVGFFLATIVNIFFANEMFYWLLTYLGIALFLGLTIYDTQKIKQMTTVAMVNSGGDVDSVVNLVSVGGALRLYLDFINLFILLLRIFGRRR